MELLAVENVMLKTVRHVKMMVQDVHNVNQAMVWVMMDYALYVEMDLIISAHHVLLELVIHVLRTAKPVVMISHVIFATLVIEFNLFMIQQSELLLKTVLNVLITNIPHPQRLVQHA